MRRNSNGISARVLVMAVALTLIIGGIIGGSVAWLTAKTDPVVNTFTYGDIKIELTETKPDDKTAKIIPGVDIEKDPKVTVKAGSEPCWLFVKVEEEGTFVNGKVSYSVRTDGNDGWKKLTGVEGVNNVYYRELGATNTDTDYYILEGDQNHPNGVVTVSENLTKAEVNSITTQNQPKLTFTAYAVQKDGVADAATAWAKVNP